MPYLNLSKELQIVTRYTYLDSDDPNGIRFARYEREVAAGRGDEYSEIYIGVNFFLYGHKLKLQSGLQYADMADRAADGGVYTGLSWTTGFRLSW
jgi:phosphate-selective porin OprO/OprP